MFFDRFRENLSEPPPEFPISGEDGKIIRKRLVFYGRVQGVGFRYTMQYAARDLGITGWCRNEYDGSVSSEVQGKPEAIRRLIRALQSGGYIRIERIEQEDIAADTGEGSFRVLSR